MCDYQILTPDGFSDFDGIVKKNKLCLVLKTTSNEIEVTLNHLVFLKSGLTKSAKSLLPGDILFYGDAVVSVKLSKLMDVYDPINVKNGSRYISNGIVHHNCSFIGSSNTLITGEKIAALPMKQPHVTTLDGFKAFYPPVRKTPYCMTVDVAEGGGGDYSTFVIFDISTFPYKIVATFRNNRIHTLAYPEVIQHYAKMYNDAFILVETNSLGQQVADALFYDLEYENMYMSTRDDVIEGFGARVMPGVKTTKKTKAIGCNTIKLIVESDKLEVNDSMVIDEMSTFTRKGATFKADEGKTDDLMMCLVTFGFLTTTTVFKNLFDFSLRSVFIQKQLDEISSEELPMGYFNDGRDDENELNILLRF